MQELYNEKPTLFDLLRSPLTLALLEDLLREGSDSISKLLLDYQLTREYNLMDGSKMSRYQVLAKKYNKSADNIRKRITKMNK